MRRGCSAEGLSQKRCVPLKGETKRKSFYSGSADAAFQHLPGNTADTSDVLHPAVAGIVLYLKYQSLDLQNVSIKMFQSKMLNPRVAHSLTYNAGNIHQNKSFTLRFSLKSVYLPSNGADHFSLTSGNIFSACSENFFPSVTKL